MCEWIEALPDSLAQHAAVLRRMLPLIQADQRIRAFEIKGSLARGNADEYSDIDARAWIGDSEYDDVLADLPALVRAVSETIDILFETPGSSYLFVQYADGVQLELRAFRASERDARVAGTVVLLDRDALLDDVPESGQPWDADLWTGWAWMRLYDVDKLLRRGSLWEALNRLEEARARLLRHHAATLGVPEPELGITSIVDAGAELPARLEETVASLDAEDLRRAALACAEVLCAYDPRPFGTYVIERLRTF